MRDGATRGTGGWRQVAEMQGLGAMPQPAMSAVPACLEGSSSAATQEVCPPAQTILTSIYSAAAPAVRVGHAVLLMHRCKEQSTPLAHAPD